MISLRQGFARLAGLFRKREFDERLDEELAFHLDKLTERYVRGGLDPDEARAAARRDMGRIDPVKETYRNQRGVPVIETFLRDARVGIRSLARTPVFTLTALSSLILGIGANSAIFSVINAALLRPLPYPNAERIVQVVRPFPNDRGVTLNRERFLAVREYNTVFEAFAAFGSSTGLNMVTGESAEYVTGKPVSHEFLDVLGVAPALGRSFTPEEDQAGGADVVVLSHEIWERNLQADPDAIGRVVTLSGVPHTVVGVMPPEFRPIPEAHLWIPLRPATNGQGNGFNYVVLGLLASSVEIPQAQTELDAIARGLRETNPDQLNEQESLGVLPYAELVAGDVRPALLVLMGAVGVVLLIACANVANLLLARAMNREREMAMRTALGATRGRLVAQMLTESLLLAVTAGLAGLLLAWQAAPFLMSLSPAAAPWREVRLDATVIGVTLAASVVTGVMFGLIPALVGSRSVSTALREDGTRSTGNVKSNWFRQAFVALEVAMSMVLLVGAALLVRSFLNLRALDLGFVPERVLTAQMSLSDERFRNPEIVLAFYQTGLTTLSQIPGVEGAAVVSGLPVERGLNIGVRMLDNGDLSEFRSTDYRYITASYFEVMGIELIGGRGFEERDRVSADGVVIVNSEFARQFLPENAALGSQLKLGGSPGNKTRTVVGIVADVQEQGLGGRAVPVVYVLVEQADVESLATAHYFFPISWVVRTRGEPRAFSNSVRAALRSVDLRVPISRVRTMDEIISHSIGAQRFQTVLLSTFSIVAIVLATAGIYGLMAYTVSSNLREIGIRMALGASTANIVRSIVKKGLLIAGLGAAVGLAGTLVLAGSLDAFVFGISSTDPVTVVAVMLSLMVVTTLAGAMPALRAVRRDPVRTLRTE